MSLKVIDFIKGGEIEVAEVDRLIYYLYDMLHWCPRNCYLTQLIYKDIVVFEVKH